MPLYRPSQKSHASVPARTAGLQSDPSSHSIEELPIRVVIAMAAELERMGWGIIVSNQSDMRLIAQAASCSEVLKLLKAQRADVTLIDEAMLEMCIRDRCRNGRMRLLRRTIQRHGNSSSPASPHRSKYWVS